MSQNTKNDLKYSAMLYTKTSNKLFMIHVYYFTCIYHRAGKAKQIESVTRAIQKN